MAKYLFLFGIAIVIVGVTAGYVAGEWIPIPLGLTVAGGIIVIIGLLIASRGFWRRRSTQTGINAIVATTALVVILGLLNFLGIRYGRTIDLTENNLYTLAPQSQQLVKNLEEPLTVWIFQFPASEENKRLLENYQQYSDNFEFEFIDPQTNIGKVQEFGVETYGEVYVEYEGKTQFVQQVNEGEIISEVKLTSVIRNIQRDRVSFVYILQGHGEPPLEEVQGGLSQAVASLREQGYQVEPFNFAEQTNLPSTPGSVLIIASPQQALFPGEITAISEYVAGGGNLLLLLDPDSNGGLESLFDPWGIQLDDRVIIDASGQGQVLGFNIATALVTRYGDHPITNPFGNGITVYPLARPVDVIETENVEATPLAYTNEQSWAESDTTQEQVQYNPNSDRAGPLVLAFALNWIETPAETNQTEEETTETSPDTEEETIDTSPDAEANQTEEETTETSPDTEEETIDTSPDAETNQTEEETTETSPDTEEETIDTSPDAETNQTEEETTETPPDTEEETIDTSPDAETNQTEEEDSLQPSPDSRVVIFGDSDFAKNGLFVQQLNGDIFLNSIDWLVGSEDEDNSFALRPQEETNRRINLTPQQAAILSRTATGIVPLFGLILALISWLRRR